MADNEGIKDIVNQVAILEAVAIMMAFRDTDTASWAATTPKPSETQR